MKVLSGISLMYSPETTVSGWLRNKQPARIIFYFLEAADQQTEPALWPDAAVSASELCHPAVIRRVAPSEAAIYTPGNNQRIVTGEYGITALS